MTKEERRDYDKKRYPETKDKGLARQRERYQNPLVKAQRAARSKAWYQKNREKVLAHQKNYKQTPEAKAKKVISDKKYRQSQEGKTANRKANHKRKALRFRIKYEVFNDKEVFERDGYRCQHCGKKTRSEFKPNHPLYPNLDHILPLSKGGEHSRLNAQCLCFHCNLVKYNNESNEQIRMFG